MNNMKKFSKLFVAFLSGVLVFASSSCSLFSNNSNNNNNNNNNQQEEEDKPQKIDVTGISFSLEKTQLKLNEKTRISSQSVLPNDATDKTIIFTSENTSVLQVEGEEITAVGYGKTNIVGTSISNPKINYKVECEVKMTHVSSLNLSLFDEFIEVNGSTTATVNVLPEDANNKAYTLRANLENIVKFEGNKITGLNTGVVSIKAIASDNNIESNSVYLEVRKEMAKGITVSSEKTSLEIGETVNITYKVLPETVEDKEVVFKTESGNSNVLSVSSTGVVTGKAVGEETVIISMKNKPEVFNKIKFTIVAYPVTSINLTASKTEIEVSETLQLNAEVLPSNATDKSVNYAVKSGKNDVIKVSKTGLVTGVYPGSDTIVCSSVGNPEIKAELTITVKETPPGEIVVEEENVSVHVNEEYQINASVLPLNATDKELAYFSVDRNDYVDRGTTFESGSDFDYSFDKPVLLNETITIDIRFKNTDEKQKISLMFGQGWNQYFGYYNLWNDGTLDSNYAGVSVSEPSEKLFRFTFDLSKLDRLGDKPAPNEYIDLIYIRGAWSLAEGSIEVNPQIKKDILSVDSNGLVSFTNIGEQKVKVYLKNHPSIYKEISFNISPNPNDPIGDDIYHII